LLLYHIKFKRSIHYSAENLCNQERKELLSLFRNKTSDIPGKNPALGIFPKATIYEKTAFYFCDNGISSPRSFSPHTTKRLASYELCDNIEEMKRLSKKGVFF
jgi:hypothetical protein